MAALAREQALRYLQEAADPDLAGVADLEVLDLALATMRQEQRYLLLQEEIV